tara:strand:+ start:3826 stop:4347 length:522 start_codon:yes stop_codon:yes gene_type:complete
MCPNLNCIKNLSLKIQKKLDVASIRKNVKKPKIQIVGGSEHTNKIKTNNVDNKLSVKYIEEVTHLEDEMGDLLTPDFKKIIKYYFGPNQKNRQLADMLMKYARKINQAGRYIIKEEKEKRVAEIKKQKALDSLKKLQDQQQKADEQKINSRIDKIEKETSCLIHNNSNEDGCL